MSKRKFRGEPIVPALPVPTSSDEPQYASVKDEYPYKPLADPKNHIRVLVIKPGKGSSVLIGQFLTRLLTPGVYQGDRNRPKPAYDALSYAWGDSKKQGSMRIGDRNQTPRRNLLYQVKISQTLQSCLRHLRDEKEERCLWIDSLCINQNDHDEKSDQVGVMGRVYRQAEQVRVWLGETSDDSDRVFGLIEEITKLDGIEKVVGNAKYTRRWRAFGALMRRKWFSRRWIVQEIALARKATIHCGRKKMDWDVFSNGVALYENRSEEVLRSLVSHEKQDTNAGHISVQVQALGAHSLISTLHQLFRRGRSNEISEYLLPLDTLISMLPNFDVSNSKDVIYAIRSLAKDFQEPDWCGNGPSIIDAKRKAALMPNYNQTTIDVFLEFIQYVIQTTKRLDIICVPWAPSLKGDEAGNYLPSWITQVSKRPFSQHEDEKDGHFRRDNADSLVGRLGAEMVYKVSGNTTTKDWVVYKDDRHHPRLVVKGRKIGDIGKLGDSAEKGWVPYSWLDMAIEVEKRREATNSLAGGKRNVSMGKPTASMANLSIADEPNVKANNVPKIEVPDSFWRTIVGDRGPGGENPKDFYKEACNKSFERKRQFLKTDEEVSSAVWNSKNVIEKSRLEFLRRVQATSWKRRFMVTQRDTIGLAPPEAIVGDMICLLWGCSVPVILRNLGGKKCRLIGECYVHGIMNGEFLGKNLGIEAMKDELNREVDIV